MANIVLGSLSVHKQLSKNSTEERHELHRPPSREYDDALIRLTTLRTEIPFGDKVEDEHVVRNICLEARPRKYWDWVRTYTDDMLMDPFARVLEIFR